MEKIIDLHIHTTISDGYLTPKEVIDESYKNKVSTISITDHDTISAYTNQLFDYANSKNIKIINGVEISTKTKNGIGIHVLGYNFDLNNITLQKELSKIRNARHNYLYNVSKKLNDLGYFLNIKKLDKLDVVTKAHIALDIINNKINEKILLQKFSHIPNKGEFIETLMNENCPAYIKKETITPKEATQIIKNANGKVVLAHPVAYIHEDNLTDIDILNIVKDMNPDGIESNYLYVNRYNQKINESKKWNQFAKDNNLFVTIGSDFHNKDGIRPEIGFINTNFTVDNKIIDQTLNFIEE